MKALLRIPLLAFLLVALCDSLVHAQAVWNGRQYNRVLCGNRNCQMCYGPNGIAAQLSAQSRSQMAIQYIASPVASVPVAASTQQSTRVAVQERVPVVTRVKRCNGRQCWYENVTTYVTRTVYKDVAVPTQAAEPSEPELDLLHVDTLEPMPKEAVAWLVRIVDPDETTKVWDLGSGDGRVLIDMALNGAWSTGIEINPESAELSRRNARMFGVGNRVKVYTGDILDYDLSQCTTVTMYLHGPLMERIIAKLPSGARIISYLHPIAGATKYEYEEHVFYELVKS